MRMVAESTTEALGQVIDSIAALEGVEKTLSHIVLSRKKDRLSKRNQELSNANSHKEHSP